MSKPRKRRSSERKRRVPRHDIEPGLIPVVAEATLQRIERGLYDAKEYMKKKGYDARHQTHMTRDHIIDTQLTVEIPRGVNPKEIMTALDTALRPTPTGTWISMGVMVPLRPQEVASGRYAIHKRGITHAGSYYMPNNKWAYTVATGKDITNNFEDSGRRKPTTIFVRIHWNPYDTKPTRED